MPGSSRSIAWVLPAFLAAWALHAGHRHDLGSSVPSWGADRAEERCAICLAGSTKGSVGRDPPAAGAPEPVEPAPGESSGRSGGIALLRGYDGRAPPIGG